MSDGNRGLIREGARDIPIYRRVGVAVIGGGPAGIGAAVAAARNGADVLLIERGGCLGGTGTLGFVPEFHSCENFTGVFKELIHRMGQQGGAPEQLIPGSFSIAYDVEFFKFVAQDLVEEAGGKILLNTWAVDALVEDNKVRGVIVENKSGRQAVLADVVIDASGDADIAAHAGAPMQEHTLPQPMMMIFRIGGVDYNTVEEYAVNNPQEFRRGTWWDGGPLDGVKNMHISGWYSIIKEAVANGTLPKGFTNYFSILGISPAARKHKIAYIYAVKAIKREPFIGDDISEAELEGRKEVRTFLKFLKTVPGFESSFLIDLAPEIGVRDSRRILGEYTLTREDIFERHSFDDEIVLHSHHGPNVVGWVMHPPDGTEGTIDHRDVVAGQGENFIVGIPYRCLVPQKIEQLLVAGKTISMTYEAHTRCRSMPPCMAFGQAAGVAAAMAVQQKIAPRQVDVQTLRDSLMKQGVNLQNRDFA